MAQPLPVFLTYWFLKGRDMSSLDDTRRRFMTHFAGIGLGSTLAPGVLWARMQDAGRAAHHARRW